MGVIINPESELGRELQKWNKPYRYVPFPKMVYKAQPWVRENGKVRCLAPSPSLYGWSTPDAYHRAEVETEAFNLSNQRIVQSESELEQAQAEGWRDTPKAAEDYYEQIQQDIAEAAAAANYQAARMSPAAQAEKAAADESTEHHVLDVKPARKARGWPKGKPRRRRVVTAVRPDGEET